jgi:UMF1 family MFS transporter
VLGAIADQGGPRRALLTGFTLLAVTATGLLWLVRLDPAYVSLALMLVAVASLGTESAGVLYNALLPALARPGRIGRWSGWGWGLGYLGASPFWRSPCSASCARAPGWGPAPRSWWPWGA